jgi:hypothetical protein
LGIAVNDDVRVVGHVACTSMVVSVGAGDDYVTVEFPDRPRIHRSRLPREVGGAATSLTLKPLAFHRD